MAPIVAFAVAFPMVYLLVFFVGQWIQEELYSEPMPGLWWRSLVSSIPFAGLLLLFPSRMDVMFTENLHWTLLEVIVWWIGLWLVCGFHRLHAFVVGFLLFSLGTWMVTLAIESLGGVQWPKS